MYYFTYAFVGIYGGTIESSGNFQQNEPDPIQSNRIKIEWESSSEEIQFNHNRKISIKLVGTSISEKNEVPRYSNNTHAIENICSLRLKSRAIFTFDTAHFVNTPHPVKDEYCPRFKSDAPLVNLTPHRIPGSSVIAFH